jgi:hypothetical protein
MALLTTLPPTSEAKMNWSEVARLARQLLELAETEDQPHQD